MSRLFKNCVEAVNEIERDIVEMGIKVHPDSMQNKYVKDNDDFSTLEVQNYSFTIIDTSDKDTIVEEDLKWCNEEFKERTISIFQNPGIAWKLREKIWAPFLNKEGQMDYTYNERMNTFGQIDHVIRELTENPDSRQCIIHVHFPRDIKRMRRKRVPCSIYYQLMVRRGKLDIIYNMRSSDFANHFKNDIWLADELRNYIANKVNIEPGLFMMNIGSLHIYKKYGKSKVVF